MRRPTGSRRPRLVVERLEAKQLLAVSFLVTTTADSGPGSLRQAILDLNAAPTTSYPSDTINFAIPGTGTHTIAPADPLPVITNPANIDGDSQPGYPGGSLINRDPTVYPPAKPVIVLDGVNAVAAGGGPVDGLDIRASDTVSVTALEIIRFSGTAVNIDGSRSGDGSNVSSCFIGTDGVDGQDLGNGGYGVRFVNPSYYNQVFNSVIEYNSLQGISYPTAPPASFGPTSFVTVEEVDQDHNDTQAPLLRITPSDDNSRTVEAGSTQTLAYTVTNAGAFAATDVTVALMLSQSSGVLTVGSTTTTVGTVGDEGDGTTSSPFASATLGTLAPGDSATITVTVLVNPEATAAGNASITATVASPQLGDNAAAVSGTYTLALAQTATSPAPVTIDGPTAPVPVAPPTMTLTIDGPTAPVPVAPPVATEPPTVAAPADLVVSSTAPTAVRVGAAGLFQFAVRNAGSGAAGDAVAAVDLAGVPAGSFYAILSQSGGGGSGTLTPLPGRPGVYLVDLGSLAAGASATVAIMIMPDTSGPLNVAVAATDAGNPAADPNPADNLAYAGTIVAPAIVTGSMTSASTIQLDFSSPLSRVQADNLAHYQLATATATATTPVALRSASSDATRRRVTLRLAHPLPASVAQVRLTTTSLDTSGDSAGTTLLLTRGRPKR